jgi:effector-binding domain-containing protein
MQIKTHPSMAVLYNSYQTTFGELGNYVGTAVKELPRFKCLSARHEGPWEGMSQTYKKMMQYISAQRLGMNGIIAEAYLHIDLAVPENNITEIQIGLL